MSDPNDPDGPDERGDPTDRDGPTEPDGGDGPTDRDGPTDPDGGDGPTDRDGPTEPDDPADPDGPGDLKLGWESLKGLSANAVQAAIGFAGTIVFARELGPTSFGGYYFLLAIVFLVNRPIWGVADAARKRFSEHEAPRGELVSALIVVDAALVAIVAAVLFGLDPLAGRTNVPSANVVFVVLVASMVAFFPFQTLIAARGRPARSTWIDALRSVFTLPFQLWFVFAGFGAAGLGYGLAAATLVTLPLTYYSVGVRPAVPTRATFRSLWAFARYSIPGSVVGKAYDRFDVVLLGAIVSTAVAGQYEVADKLTLPALFLTGAITSGLLPKVSNRHSRGADPTADVSNALAYASLLAIPLFFGALALSQRLVVTAYGPAYAAAAPYLVGLALYKVVSSQYSVYEATLSGIDRPNVTLRLSAVALAVNVILGVGLVVAIGGIGVVIATVVAETIRWVGAAIVLRREFPGLPLVPLTVLEQVGAGIVMCVVVAGLARLLVVDSVVVTGAVVAAGAVTYGLVLLAVSRNLRVAIRAIYRDATS